MTSCVYCITKTDAQAVRIANRLRNAGFSPGDISILAPDRGGARDLGHQNATKAPEGATAGNSARDGGLLWPVVTVGRGRFALTSRRSSLLTRERSFDDRVIRSW